MKIGDYAAINMTACLQTHLYEDRDHEGRSHRHRQGRHGRLRARRFLYDSKVGDYAQIGPLTVVMKGENIPAHTAWAGAPAQPAKAVLLAQPQEAPAAEGKPEIALAA